MIHIFGSEWNALMVMTVGVPVCIIVLNDIFQHYFWTKVEGGVDKVKVALHSGNVEMGYVALKKNKHLPKRHVI